jgi:hypothetical protein
MKFAANNSYATDTDQGFANTWYVLAFEDKQSRDEYIAKSHGLAVKAITKAEIPTYIEAPKPFTGAKRAIGMAASEWPGLIGEVCVCYPNDANYLQDL